MAIPPRVIGGSQEAQLLWNISNQLETQKGILSPASTNTILTNGSQLTQIVDSWGNPVYNSDYVDVTSDVLIYEGWKLSGGECRIRRIDLSTPVIIKLWATGLWADRASLIYV